MEPLRRLAYPLRLASARLSHRLGRAALVGLGLAAAAATIAAVLAGSVIAQDQSVGRAVAELPEPERALRAAWFGVPARAGGEEQPALDRDVRRALAAVLDTEATAAVLYRRTAIGGVLVDLGAVDGLGRWVEVRSGRLPRACRPERCEVLRLAGAGPIPTIADLRLVVVGTAVLRSDVLLGTFVEPGTYHQPATPPLLLAEGVATVAEVASLESIYRSYGWVVPLEEARLRVWDASSFGQRVAQARATLRAEDIAFEVAAPVAGVARAADSARAAGRRLLLVGGQAAALLLAFAVLAAATVRTDVASARRRLIWFGARRWQLELLTAAEVGVVAVVGTAVGWALGTGLAAVLSSAAGAPVGAVLAHSVLSSAGAVVAIALALVTGLVVHLAVRARPVRVRGFALHPLDVAALGALALVVAVVARGAADADALVREGGTGALLLLLPGLVAFIAAVACARSLGPGLRALERLARRRSTPLRLAALSLARHPGYAAVAIAFLVVSLGLALFAEAYRSTLSRGQSDAAAYDVPVDAIVREDIRELVQPLDAAPLERYAAATEGEAFSALRRNGSIARLEGSGSVTLVALPARELTELSWRRDFASRSPKELAPLITPRAPGALRGIPLPDDVRELRLPLRIRGTPIGIVATLVGPDGRFSSVDLGKTGGRSALVLRAAVPPEAQGGKLVGLTFNPPRRVEEPGASAGHAARGVVSTKGIEIVGATVARATFDEWVPTNASVSAVVAGDVTQLHYALSNLVRTRFRARQVTDEGPVPVLVTPRIAAAAGERGVLPVALGGQTLIARVAGVVRRFPTVGGEAVVADRDLAVTALNASQPGTAAANEVWIRDSPPNALSALSREPFASLDVTTRAQVAERLKSDPLARAALLTLTAAALVGLALAVLGLVLGVVADLRDERGELLDLEAQGATPAALRRQVRLRTGLVAAVGLLGGAVTGAALSLLVVDLVRLTANAAAPEPPLVTQVSWPVIGLAVALYAVLAGALVWLTTARAFRAAVPPTRAAEAAA